MKLFRYCLFFLFFYPLSCGEITGFSSLPELDLGDIMEVRLYLTDEEIRILNDSVSEDIYASCIYEQEDTRSPAYVKVRGFTSRLNPKKSLTLKFERNGYTIKYALEAAGDFYVTNRLAMYAYNRAGLPAPETVGIALFINDIYQGYYIQIKMYCEQDLEAHYYNKQGELFKAYFPNMGNDIPLHGLSEKKFPDNNDFSSLDSLIYSAKNLNDDSWSEWVKENLDWHEIVKYMVVHDFLTVVDTDFVNFYIYNYSKMLLLPWDNERCIRSGGYALGGDNMLTKRIFSLSFTRQDYNDTMYKLFLDPADPEYILDDLMEEANRIFNEVDKPIYYEENSYSSYEDYLEEKQKIINFLDPIKGRASKITYPPLPIIND